MSIFYSPFIVPLGAFAIAIFAIVSGALSQAHSRRLKAEQRLALIARGVPLAEIESYLNAGREFSDLSTANPLRRMTGSRTASMVLISVGVGIAIFGLLLAKIVGERDVLVVAAAGLIPLAIGIGFFVDYTLHKRDLALFQGVGEDQGITSRK